MSYIKEINGNEMDKFIEYIPNSIIIDSLTNDNYIYYGIVEDNEAIGVIVMETDSENVEFTYAYVLPVYRGRGIMSRALNQLIVVYWYKGYQNLHMSYNPKLAPAIDKYADTNEFVKIELDNAYFEFSLQVASESKLWSKKILHTRRMSELDESQKQILYAAIENLGIEIFNEIDTDRGYLINQSIVYMNNEVPEGLLIVGQDENKKLDAELVYLKSKDVMAPYYMISALHENLENDYPLETIVSFYSKNGYMTGVLEKILGTKGYREIIARYDLSRVAVYSDIPIV